MSLLLYEVPDYEGVILDWKSDSLPVPSPYPEKTYLMTPEGRWYVLATLPRSTSLSWFHVLDEGVPEAIRMHALLLSAAI